MSDLDGLRGAIGSVMFDSRNWPEGTRVAILGRSFSKFRDLIADVVFVSPWLSEYTRAAQETAWDHCLDEIDANEINTDQAREGNPYRKEAHS